MTRLLHGIAGVVLAVFSTAAAAAPISYNLKPFQIDVVGSGAGGFFDGVYSVTGSILTDGTLGQIFEANVLSATATAVRTDGQSKTITYDPLDTMSSVNITDVMVSATATDILLDFAAGGSISFTEDGNTYGFRAGSIEAFVIFPLLSINATKEVFSGTTGSIGTVAGLAPVPLPPAIALFGAGFAVFGFVGRRRATKPAIA